MKMNKVGPGGNVHNFYRTQGKVMFSHASMILFTIGLMDTRSLLILVGYLVSPCYGVGTHPTGIHSFYRPQRIIFTPVCHSFCSQEGGGVCLSACWDGTPHPRKTPRDHTPPGPYPPDQADPPWDQTPPRPGRQPPGPGRPPPPGSRLQNTVYERPVRILLECILVLTLCLNKANHVAFDFVVFR